MVRFFTLLLIAVCGITHANTQDRQLEKLMGAYWQDYLRASPISASYYGDQRYQDRLDDVSERSFKKQKRKLSALLKKIQRIDPQRLSRENQVNYDLFQSMLTKDRTLMDYNWHTIAFNTIGGWQTVFADLVRINPFQKEKDYEDYLKRLSAVKVYARQTMTLMRKGIQLGYVQPCAILKNYEHSIDGFVSPSPKKSVFYEPFTRIPAVHGKKRIENLQKKGLRTIQSVVYPTYKEYSKFFTQEYRQHCRKSVGVSSIPEGRQLYDFFISYYTTTNMNADQVHKLGLKEVRRIRKRMEGVMREVAFQGSFKKFLHMLKTDEQFYAKSEDELIAKASAVAKVADGKMPKFFAHLSRIPYGIQPIPAPTAPKSPAGYYQSGTPDGTRAGFYFLNTWDLKSRPLYTLPALTLHEAVPGHHHQIAIQRELGHLPDFRRFRGITAYSEGWGLYSEHLGEEMGIYKTPYEQFGRLTYEMWRAARLVVDSGIHSKGWSRKKAIEFISNISGLSHKNITSEVDRYISWPGQALAYKIGELKILALRKKAETVLGGKFDLRQFHSEILRHGPVPLKTLDRIVHQWIDRQ